MARWHEAEAVYAAADLFRDRCLVQESSLLWPEHEAWSVENISVLYSAFVDHPDLGEGNFLQKWRKQLENHSDDIVRVAADALAVYCLYPYQGSMDAKAKLDAVTEVINWRPDALAVNPHEWAILESAFHHGIGGTGTYYNTSRPDQIAFILEFSRGMRAGEASLDDVASCKVLAERARQRVGKQVNTPHVLLHLLFPDHFERIASGGHKQLIVNAFSELTGGATDIDEAILNIRQALVVDDDAADLDFYAPTVRARWDLTNRNSGPTKQEMQRIRSFVEDEFPDEDTRLTCLERLRDSILLANSVWTGSWGTSFRRDVIRLNVGPIECVTLSYGSIQLSVDTAAADEAAWDRIFGIEGVKRQGFFKPGAVPDARRVSVLASHLMPGLMELSPTHESLIRRVGRVHRTSYYRSHAPAILQYLREELESEIPDPDYVMAEPPEDPPVRPPTVGSIRDIRELTEVTHLEVAELEERIALLEEKRQIVLEGPPGSGKTYLADKLARHFTGNPLDGQTDERVEIVQFHQSYGYEDFVQGIRPATDEHGALRYVVQPGIFTQLCRRARHNPDKRFVLIIDEINRGNLSRIFGELLLLLEYCDQSVRLPYGTGDGTGQDDRLTIPTNLYLIGTMNSTDRSLALMDYALRRRFYFYRLLPVQDGRATVLEQWLGHKAMGEKERSHRLQLFLALNERIGGRLSPDFQIGHSYFMTSDIGTDAGLERVWRRAVLPLLAEYFHNARDMEATLRLFEIDALTPARTDSMDIDAG